MEKTVDKMLEAKLVQPSKSGFNAPAILVRKANFDKNKTDSVAKWRLVLDFRKVNALTVLDYQPRQFLSQTC
jgi:hypothetical protein